MQSLSVIRMLFLSLALQLIVVTVRASVNFEDCGSAYDLRNVFIEGCGTRLPCYMTLGTRTLVRLEFVADFESNQLDQHVTISINSVDSPAPVTPEPCEMVACPLKTYSDTTFLSTMSVPTNIATNQRGRLEWRMYNENGKQVICYYLMVQTQTIIEKIAKLSRANFVDYSKLSLIEFYKDKLINKTLDKEEHLVMQSLMENLVVDD